MLRMQLRLRTKKRLIAEVKRALALARAFAPTIASSLDYTLPLSIEGPPLREDS